MNLITLSCTCWEMPEKQSVRMGVEKKMIEPKLIKKAKSSGQSKDAIWTRFCLLFLCDLLKPGRGYFDLLDRPREFLL